MKIDFRKIAFQPKAFFIQNETLVFEGEVKRIGDKLFRVNAILNGELKLVCDRSGEEYFQKIEEDLVLYISNGIWDTQSQKVDDLDVIEFFDGFIDFEYILQSEIDLIQMQYHIKEGE